MLRMEKSEDVSWSEENIKMRGGPATAMLWGEVSELGELGLL